LDVGHTAAAIVVVTDGEFELVVGRLVRRRIDLATVDALARLTLAARRQGLTIRLVDASPELRALLELVGLDGLLLAGAESALEADGEAELGEQLGVEEVVEPGDPPA
jgi:STAS domain